METIQQTYNEIIKYIDLPYLLAFMAIAYMLKSVIMEIIVFISKKDLYKSKLTKNLIIFFIGTITALPFWYGFGHDKMMLFVTFCVGTSIHDLLVKTISTVYAALLKKFLKTKEDE
jgi:TctA family transporter